MVKPLELSWLNEFVYNRPFSVGRIACDSDSEEEVIYRDNVSSKNLIAFGTLGAQETNILSGQKTLQDRPEKAWEKLIPFCLEIVPQFSSEENPVTEEDLMIAIKEQFQKQEWFKHKKN